MAAAAARDGADLLQFEPVRLREPGDHFQGDVTQGALASSRPWALSLQRLRRRENVVVADGSTEYSVRSTEYPARSVECRVAGLDFAASGERGRISQRIQTRELP
jgi:hypothetical protein